MQDGATALANAIAQGYADTARLLLENRATMDFEDDVRRTDMIKFCVLNYHQIRFYLVDLETVSLWSQWTWLYWSYGTYGDIWSSCESQSQCEMIACMLCIGITHELTPPKLHIYRRRTVPLLWVWLVRMDKQRLPGYCWTTGQLWTTKIRYIQCNLGIICWSPWWNVVTLQKGQSAVHLASVGGHTETLKVLIEKAPQLNLQDQVTCEWTSCCGSLGHMTSWTDIPCRMAGHLSFLPWNEDIWKLLHYYWSMGRLSMLKAKYVVWFRYQSHT